MVLQRWGEGGARIGANIFADVSQRSACRRPGNVVLPLSVSSLDSTSLCVWDGNKRYYIKHAENTFPEAVATERVPPELAQNRLFPTMEDPVPSGP